ncbi:ABC transporter permease [Iodobacter fluviatilis]|uniref:Transport permease protein n=1 Tax=Iodobacter fluviatilis TaxID=537 RepID=A0A377SWX9_9NEIS|nr:ABC transporter permease [Iodobacter fluviatilis]TCU87992.1 lipopolysaccharide transport system permease protein [Iodobacter fluviatilis]STR45493.1 ABC-2 type transporter [Iodobacter fluviatilis]
MEIIRRIFAGRWLLHAMVSREIKSRYSGSVLGIFWLFFAPVLMILTYSLVFADLMKSRLPGVNSHYAYTMYLTSGMLVWQYFAEIVGRGKLFLVENAGLLRKNNISKIIPLISVVTIALVNSLVLAGFYFIFLIILNLFSFQILAVYLLQILVITLFSFSIAGLLALAHAYVRDVGQFVDAFMQILFWATPIVYAPQILPQWAAQYIYLNPVYWVSQLGQQVVLDWPLAWNWLLNALLLSIALFLIFYIFYAKNIQKIMDDL